MSDEFKQTDFKSLDELWSAVEERGGRQWYGKAESYWKTQSSTVDGMLGGFGFISNTDVAGSALFIRKVLAQSGCAARRTIGPENKVARALDCGGGIGRVTRDLLSKLADKVDLLEGNAEFTAKAREHVGSDGALDQVYTCTLQDFQWPEGVLYDIVWVQWVALYLTDADLIAFLRRAREHLAPGGGIFMKENVMRDAGDFAIDEDDNSVTRDRETYSRLMREAGLEPVVAEQQRGFPKELFPVYMYGWADASES